jgi:hypothetical protein
MYGYSEKKPTLVACLNITNDRFVLVAASYSTPMMIPLSMRTAVDRQYSIGPQRDEEYIRTQRIEI